MAHIFISYASPDREIADEVSGWLRAAGHEPFMDHDLRDGISVGEDWKRRLYRELRDADAVIGVVTSSYVASNWCSAELGIADALGCRLMPLRVETNTVHPLMRDLQYADYRADPEQARDRVLQAVRLLDDGGGRWREGDNPFPGLEPFTAALSQVFFGRTAEARDISNRLRAGGSAGGILAIVGPSGCGKSSLLNAAVAPLLEGDPAWLMVPPLVPGSDPLPELARTLATTAHSMGLSWSASDVRDVLEASTDGLRRVADDLLAAGPALHQRRLLVMIDQAEELFTRTTSIARQRFAQLLHDAVAGPVQVAAAMRSEFLDDLRDLPALAGVPIEAYVLAPLGREMLRDIIEQPAKVARLRLDDGLTAALVADTGSGEALPLLAFTLRQLADGVPVGGKLSQARYHDLGGVQGALTRHADVALTDAVRVSGLTEHEILAGLTRLVTVDETGRRARRRIKLTGLSESLRVGFRVFVDRRLLLSDTDDEGQVWITVAHEALLTWWRPLDSATADIMAALRTVKAVEQAADEWDSADRSDHFLWDAKRLTTTLAVLGMTGNGGKRNPFSSSVVELSEQAQRFLDATDRLNLTKKRQQRIRLVGLSTLLLLTAIAGWGWNYAVVNGKEADRQRDIAWSNQIAMQAERLLQTDVSLAAQLDLIARNVGHEDSDLDTTLLTMGNTALSAPPIGHTESVNTAVFSPDGRTLASGSDDHSVRLWDVTNSTHPTPLGLPLTGHAQGVNAVAFSPDGRMLVSGSNDRSLRLWDVTNPAYPTPLGQPLTGHDGGLHAVAFSPDGHTLATGSADKTVRLWNLTDRTHPTPLGQPLTGPAKSISSVAFSPDGNTLATGSDDRTVRLWNVTDPAEPMPLGSQALTGHTDSVNTVAFSPNGRTLASASKDGTTRLWNIPSTLLVGHPSHVDAVAFSRDRRSLASGSDDGSVRLWNVADPVHPTPAGPPLTGHTKGLRAVAFSPDGHILATGSDDRTVRLWNVADPAHPTPAGPPLTGHTKGLRAVAFSPDGHILATGSEDRTVRLWNLSNPAHPTPLGQPLTGHTDWVNAVAFSLDGRTLASASVDKTVRLWNLSNPAHPTPLGQPLTGHTDWVNAVAFSPDGRTLVSGSNDRSVRLWNVTDPAQPVALGPPLTDHEGWVGSVAFSPDGRTLASGSADKNVQLWDVADPAHPTPRGQPLTGHTDLVYAVAFSPDGHTLVSGSGDRTVRIWGMDVEQAIRRVCAITGGTLTPQEWRKYRPSGLEYQRPCP